MNLIWKTLIYKQKLSEINTIWIGCFSIEIIVENKLFKIQDAITKLFNDRIRLLLILRKLKMYVY